MTTQIRKEQLEFSQSDGSIKIPVTTQDKDFTVDINDGGINRTAIQIHGDEGSVSFPRQSAVSAVSGASAQTIATATFTDVVFAVEHIDVLGEFVHTTGIFTAKDYGKYLITFRGAIDTLGSGKYVEIRFSVNNTTVGLPGYNLMFSVGVQIQMNVSEVVVLQANDTLRVKVYHNHGSNKNLLEYRQGISITKVA